MNKIAAILCLLAFLTLHIAKATTPPASYKGEYAKALAKAKKEGKMILLLFVSDDCVACEKADNIIKKDNEVVKVLAKSFVVLKTNIFKEEGSKLARSYGIREVPACVYIDNKGEKLLGPAQPTSILNNAQSCIKLAEYRKVSTTKGDDINMQREYVNFLQTNFRSTSGVDSITVKYLNSLTEGHLKDSVHAKELFELAPLVLKLVDVNSKLNQHLLSNKEWYYSRFGKNETDARLIKIAFSSAEQSIDKHDSALFVKSVAQMASFPEYAGKTVSYKTMIGPNFVEIPNMKFYRNKYLRINHPREFIVFERKEMERIWNNADSLCAFAKGYLDYYSSTKLRMTKARDCIHRSIELKNNYEAQYTLAAVFYALELEKEAEEAALKAKAMARESKEDYSDAVILIEKIRSKRKYKELR